MSAEIDTTKFYASWVKDAKTLKKSTSGGLFMALAHYTLKRGGVVYGAAFDDGLNLRHIGVENASFLHKLQGSKYLQSHCSESIFKDIKGLLKAERAVLFVGAPCQCAGLKAYLRKDYENLLVCDFICHGVPSRLVFDKYKAWSQKKYGSKLVDVRFRSKDVGGWHRGTVDRYFNNGKVVQVRLDFDWFTRAFHGCLDISISCEHCLYASPLRISDITLGDFWHIQHFMEKAPLFDGASCLVVSSDKVDKILHALAEENQIELIPMPYAKYRNMQGGLSGPHPRGKLASAFMEDLSVLSVNELAKKYYPKLSFKYRAKAHIMTLARRIFAPLGIKF